MTSAVLLLLSMLISTVQAGDLLRGNAPANARRVPSTTGETSATIDYSRQRYQDQLSRTTQAIQAAQALQNQARAKAGMTGVNNLGAGLPVVTDGLSPNGLNYRGTKVGFEGGHIAPTQSVGTDGRTTVTVKQLKDRAFLEWNGFNIGRGTTLYFDQSGGGRDMTKWIAFNEVLGATSPSQIMGQIRSQGHVYVINQNGIIFGGTSQVNTHTLVASSLPINTNLVQRGILNNPDNQFLFSALPIAAGKSTAAFTPPAAPVGGIGDVVVQRGARITAPTTAAKVGGRIVLVGPNVTNEGTISTPDGQVIMAAGLQVGFIAHDSNDPSIRGLDVFVGKVADPTVVTVSPTTGTVTNRGIINIDRGNLTMAGKTVQQLGVVAGLTSVSLNSSVRLDASYDAVSNVPKADGESETKRPSFLFKSTGNVIIGAGAVFQMVPDAGAEKIVGTELALRTRITIRGRNVQLGANSTMLAPNAIVNISAGVWNHIPHATNPTSTFVRSGGQVYLDKGATIDVAGTQDAIAPLSQNIMTLQLRGSEFANSPFNRNDPLRGIDITLDMRRQGVYNGFAWVGTPLADASGFLGIIERTAAELTTAGGEVNISAGNSVVMQQGSSIDVSGGWVNYEGGMVQTTRVMYRNHIFDISQATPDKVYDGIYTGSQSYTHGRWGITHTYSSPFLTGAHYEPGYVYGAAGGKINLTAPAMALDGTLRGAVVNGPRQRDLPAQPSSLSLSFTGEKLHTDGATVIPFNPNPPAVFFQSGAQSTVGAFSVNAAGDAALLPDDRRKRVFLDPKALADAGFGFIKVENPDGEITVPTGSLIKTPAQGAVELIGANVNVLGHIVSPGGTITLKAMNISPTLAATLKLADAANPNTITTPPYDARRGNILIASTARLDVAGLLVDDRLSAPAPLSLPIMLTGGRVIVQGSDVKTEAGSVIDASGGARMDWFGVRTYGDAGSISLKAGQDYSIASVLGGQLTLGATLRGFAGPGSKGGLLELQAPFIQIGGGSANPAALVFQPSFFNQGGFASFSFTGVGTRADNSKTPGVFITPGTRIEPQPLSQIVAPFGGGRDGLVMREVLYPEGMRSAVSVSFNAPTVTEIYSPSIPKPIIVRGDVVMGQGSSIHVGPLGSASFSGGTISILGSVFAPGGSISIKGADKFPTTAELPAPFVTVYVGPQSTLSAAGKVIYTPGPYGTEIGTVLPGGMISIGGNIVLEAGSKLDVSGTSGIVQIKPAYLGLDTLGEPVDFLAGDLLRVLPTSGLTTPQFGWYTVPTRIDSDGGLISLKGGELLLTRAELRGEAGGPTALGGTLLVSSGRFYRPSDVPAPSDVNLEVTQNGSNFPTSFFPGSNGVGRPVTGYNGGYFAVTDFISGGFDNLQLGGSVRFKGPIDITARGALSVATGGFLFADSTVRLTAPYVGLGTAFRAPFAVGELQNPFIQNGTPYFFNPTAGPGQLIVTANHIDIGNLTLGGIGQARLIADGGDIRGNGTFSMAGDLYLRAAQIYPTTGSAFTIVAFDTAPGAKDGSITIVGSGTVPLPMSAGGTLSLYASDIIQGGVLRAPFGTINLGWDGTGIAPISLTAGTMTPSPTAATMPVTQNLELRPGSVTSVSAIDPITGQGVLIPYGRYNANDGTWIAPNGENITVAGLPRGTIRIGGINLDAQAGSLIDIRGGGDLYAYNWAPGLLGTRDLLGTATQQWNTTTTYQTGDLVFYAGRTWSARQAHTGHVPTTGFFWVPLPEAYAILPGYDDMVQPFAAFNSTADSLLNDPGYVSTNLRAGDSLYLGTDRQGLHSGSYTLLPARYALLPGAFMVTPVTGTPIGSWYLPDGASYMNGYRFNGLNEDRRLKPIYSRWEVLPGNGALRNRAGYEDFFANEFITNYALENNLNVQRLPQDSGQLVLAAVTSMNLAGTVLAKPIGDGRGGWVDISSGSNIFIGNGSNSQPGALNLNAGQLSRFGAESLLIGGTRTVMPDGTISLNVRTGLITVDNAGVALFGPEIILASTSQINLTSNAVIRQTGTLSGPADTMTVNGNGALIRLTSDFGADTIRTGVTTPSTTGGLRIDSGATIAGNSLTLDSTSLRDYIQDGVNITGQAIAIRSGVMRIHLSGAAPAGNGLTLGSNVLDQIDNARSLSLLSYTTFDIFGVGTIGSSALRNLEIHAGAIRRESGNGIVAFQAANILLDNSANAVVTPAQLSGALAGTLLFDTGKLTLGSGRVEIAKFANLNLDVRNGLFLNGGGGLNMAGNITGSLPFIVATAGSSNQSITAGGTLTLDGALGTPPSRESVGLGSTITLSGTVVNLGTDIILPSGSINVSATTGALNVTGSLDAGGSSRVLYDLTRYTNGGTINLSAAGGNVTVDAGSVLNVSAAGGANAGRVSVSAPNGSFVLNGTLQGSATAGGTGGSFSLDVGTLPTLSTTTTQLSNAGFNNELAFRVRTGNVLVDGTTVARDFRLSADAGAINVTGTINASGVTGGTIRLSANQGLTLASGALLDVSADTFDNAGKGGHVFLETRGASGGVLNIATGSTIDLSVTETASLGDFSGTLHLRAPQNVGATDLAISTIGGTITGASSIIAEGFRVFDLTGSGGQITSTVQGNVQSNGATFGANASAIETRLNGSLSNVFSVRVGAEVINTTGDLTLGAQSGLVTNWDLSTFRFGADLAPGVLTLRANGNVNLYGAISDGFQSAAYNALLLNSSSTLPLNAQSWSYRITAGADLTAADALQTRTSSTGSLNLGRFIESEAPGGTGAGASTSTALNGNFQVIRTGSGNIEIATAGDIRLLNQFATIYTAGTLAPDQTLGGTFDRPNPVLTGVDADLGSQQQSTAYRPQYTLGGGNISLEARGNIGHFKRDISQLGTVLIADSSLQMPTNWLYRRGTQHTTTGGEVPTTSWWVDFSNFFQGVGALGGGNIRMNAGGNVSNIDAVIPTNARLPKNSTSLVELGGGDISIRAGNNIDAGVFYLERGRGTLDAGGSIVSNNTRRVIPTSSATESLLPTALFVGKGSFKIDARGDILLGPVSNPFMLPQGLNNGSNYKTWFSTFGADSGVEAVSLGGDITFRQTVALPGSRQIAPILSAYYANVMQFSTDSTVPSASQPWLRLVETDARAFDSVSNIGAASLRLSALEGDVNLVGNYNLFPSATGNLAIEAAGAINAVNRVGTSNISGFSTAQTIWASSRINLSDANPALIPGFANPINYRFFTSTDQQRTNASLNFLSAMSTPFAESGSLTNSVSAQQALHSSSVLHRGDTNPVRIYAGTGDISGLTLFSPKATRIVAGRDISDIAFYLQNVEDTDLSIVSAGRDLLPYNPSSILRTAAIQPGNLLSVSTALAGDISIGGPGTLEVLAGQHIKLGNGPSFADGTGAGIVSIGNARNPSIGLDGASLVIAAGLGSAYSLDGSDLDFDAFISKFLTGADGERYLKALAASSDIDVSTVAEFDALSDEEQRRVAMQAFFIVLREAGRDKPTTGNYAAGLDAISTLFPGTYKGNIETNSRDIRTKAGGDISLLIPGGQLTLQTQQSSTRLVPPGIVTESGGNINIFTNAGVDIGISRIFTLRGGNQIIWASTGDIAAGSSAKTVASAPPTRVIIDPTSGDVATDLAGLATGGGIGVLATVAGVMPGSVDLIAVTGNVDAGDAGIRATGNLNIAAVQVLNASNIAVGGASTGTPSAPAISVPAISVPGASNAAAATTQAAKTTQPTAAQTAADTTPAMDELPSVLSLEVIGYGGGEGETGEGTMNEDDEEERKRRKAQ